MAEGRRVEAVRDASFTQVLRTDKGKDVRADFRIVEEDPPRLLRFEQDIEGTPFEGFLRRRRRRSRRPATPTARR